MASLNKISIIGRLGKDPEMRFTQSGKGVCNFSVAVSERGKDGKDSTTWFSVSAWEKTAELCVQYLHKGSLVYIDGRVSLREYDGKDGKHHAQLEITAFAVQFLEPKAKAQAQGESYQPSDDDVPF